MARWKLGLRKLWHGKYVKHSLIHIVPNHSGLLGQGFIIGFRTEIVCPTVQVQSCGMNKELLKEDYKLYWTLHVVPRSFKTRSAPLSFALVSSETKEAFSVTNPPMSSWPSLSTEDRVMNASFVVIGITAVGNQFADFRCIIWFLISDISDGFFSRFVLIHMQSLNIKTCW